MDHFSCTESDAGPILDFVWAGLNVLGAIAVAADPDGYEDSEQIIVVGLAWGIFSSASGATGLGKTKKCRAAKQEVAALHAEERRGEVSPTDMVVQAVVLTPSVDTLAVNEQRQLIAVAYDTSGAVIPDRTFYWSSSNDAIASVSNAGLVRAHASGAAVIAARADNVVGTATIVVVRQ